MTKDTVIKFLNNRCTDAELAEVIKWAESDALNGESMSWGFDDWKLYQEGSDSGDDEKFSSLFYKIQQKISIGKQMHQLEYKDKKPSLSLYTAWLTKAAAVLLIPVLVILLYTLSENKLESVRYANLKTDSLEIIAPVGSRAVVQLPDGSEVHLNYGSKIKYPQIFSDHTREVLLSGEGYFNVAHNPEKPFIVKTGKINIKALGTVFNVMAYPGDNVVETTLINGKVIVDQIDEVGETKMIGSLVPGQHVNYNIKTGVILSKKGNIEKYIGWREGKLVFEDTPITQVAEKLSRMFNADIKVADDITDYFYTVTFKDEPLFQILDLMAIATPISYKALPRQKLPDGTFSKQKILIVKKS